MRVATFGFLCLCSCLFPGAHATLMLYGSTTFEVRNDSGTGGRTVILSHLPADCEAIGWQAKLVFDQGEAWLGHRQAGRRRIEASDLVFFQYRGLKFRMPYEAAATNSAPNAAATTAETIHYYDPFELLGFLFASWQNRNCGEKKVPYKPDWPFGHRALPLTPAAITFVGAAKGRRMYAESFQGYATDVYFCKRKIPEAALADLERRLALVKASNRIEDSAVFREYTKLREAVCGES